MLSDYKRGRWTDMMMLMQFLLSMVTKGHDYWESTAQDLKERTRLIADFARFLTGVPPFSFGYDDNLAEDTAQNIYIRTILANLEGM